MANERRNEHVRLMGNWCNAGSIAIITLGTLAPALAGVYRWFKLADPAEPLSANWQLPAASFLAGLLVHGVGHVVLRWTIDQEVPQDE